MSSDGQGSVSPAGGASDKGGEKSKRSGNLKHELRTPLNHIIGYCEMLMEQAQDDGLDIFIADLDRIHSAGEQLLGVVDDLCDRRDISRRPFPLQSNPQFFLSV